MALDAVPRERWKPSAVSFSSGGVLTVGHFGVLKRLLDSDVLSEVRAWYGCSGGSIAAYVAALGCTSRWLQECIQILDMRTMLQIQEDLLIDYTTHWGMDSGDSLTEYLGKIVDTWEPGASTWTFADFARERPGIQLGIIATNVTEQCQVLFCAEKYPAVRILDAIRASSAIPLIYTPFRLGEALYCDGAVVESFPWKCIADHDNTLVIACKDSQINKFRQNRVPRPIQTLSDYIFNILHMRSHVLADIPRNWIAVNNTTLTQIDFQMSREEMVGLFTQGERVAEAWLSFRLTAGSKNPETRSSCGPHCTSPCCQPLSPDRMSDTPSLQIPLPQRAPFQDSHTPSSLPSRRWSL
jgi:predicted acylesterase/phospholipase RssA